MSHMRANRHIAATLTALSLTISTLAPATAVSTDTVGDIPAKQSVAYVSSGNRACSGALINPQWVVTAAHCFKRKGLPGAEQDPEQVHYVSVGVGINGHTIPFTKVFFPPWSEMPWSEKKHMGDIALIRLDKKASAPTLSVSPDSVAEGSAVTVLGWGGLFFPHSDFTTTVNGVAGKIIGITPQQLGIVLGGDSVAGTGDSGGPVLNSRGEIVGIVGSGENMKRREDFVIYGSDTNFFGATKIDSNTWAWMKTTMDAHSVQGLDAHDPADTVDMSVKSVGGIFNGGSTSLTTMLRPLGVFFGLIQIIFYPILPLISGLADLIGVRPILNKHL